MVELPVFGFVGVCLVVGFDVWVLVRFEIVLGLACEFLIYG